MTFILSNTTKLFIFKPVAGMATDLTINYAKFAPLIIWKFAPLHYLLCYANFDPLNILSSIYGEFDQTNVTLNGQRQGWAA